MHGFASPQGLVPYPAPGPPGQEEDFVALQSHRGTSSTQETTEAIMRQVRDLGHCPKDYAGRGAAEQRFKEDEYRGCFKEDDTEALSVLRP